MSEIRNLKALNHPNIIKVHECYLTPNHIYVVQEFLEGENVAERFTYFN